MYIFNLQICTFFSILRGRLTRFTQISRSRPVLPPPVPGSWIYGLAQKRTVTVGPAPDPTDQDLQGALVGALGCPCLATARFLFGEEEGGGGLQRCKGETGR